MKRRLVTRILGLLSLYCAIFIALLFVQFAPYGSFNRQIGGLRVSGSFETIPAHAVNEKTDRELLIKDNVRVFFGGLEFQLSGKNADGLSYVKFDGNVQAAYPESLTMSGDSASFRLSDGQELSFKVRNKSASDELLISAVLTEDVREILLPFRTTGMARIKNDPKGFRVNYGNSVYAFETGDVDEKIGAVLLSKTEPHAAYRIIPVYDSLNPADFGIIDETEAPQYAAYLARWRDSAFAAWERRINSGNFDESVIAAFLAESTRRGVLRRSISIIPARVRGSGGHSFFTVPFLGGLDDSLNGLIFFEEDRISRITSYTQTDPSAFLTEPYIFEYLLSIGGQELFDKGIEYVNALNPDVIRLDMCAGILEGWLTWEKWRGGEENPFETLIPRVRSVILTYIKKDDAGACVFLMDGSADTDYNLRAGFALAAYGEGTGNDSWTAAGRSLILSVLSFADEDAAVSDKFDLSANGEFVASNDAGILTSAQIYADLRFSDYYPHFAGIDAAGGGIFLWTASPSVSASFADNTLDLDIRFPQEETHYVYIANIDQFSRIQLRGIDWRSDRLFEQYNAPGWLYSSSTRVLMLKMVQQSEIERVRIVF